MKAEKALLEKRLQEVNVAIAENESILSPILEDIRLQKQELANTITTGQQIVRNLRIVSASAVEDQKFLSQVDSNRVRVLTALKDYLGM